MFRRLSVPFLVLAMGALSQGCSSSSSGGGTGGTVGTGGTDGGSAGGHVGTGGAGVGGAGVGGAGVGGAAAGGAPGTDAAVDAPRDTAADAPADAPSDATTDSGVNLAALCPGVPGDAGRLTGSPQMTAADFCATYLQTCTGAANPDGGGPTTMQACVSMYNALNSDVTRECRSYHVCNAAVYFVNSVPLHCGHAIGIGLCQDTTPDASGN